MRTLKQARAAVGLLSQLEDDAQILAVSADLAIPKVEGDRGLIFVWLAPHAACGSHFKHDGGCIARDLHDFQRQSTGEDLGHHGEKGRDLFFALVVTFEGASRKPKSHVIAEAIEKGLPVTIGESGGKICKGRLGNVQDFLKVSHLKKCFDLLTATAVSVHMR